LLNYLRLSQALRILLVRAWHPHYDGTYSIVRDVEFVSTRTPVSRTAELEAATEAVAAWMGTLNTRIHNERKKPTPNETKIQRLSDELVALRRERNALDPDDEAAVKAMLKTYSEKLKPGVDDGLQP
jgi:hypothetical protein